MNNEDNTNLDLLDLDGDTSDSLPEVAFASPRPRKPWLLLGIGLVVIALATYIIVKTVTGDSSSRVEIDLDAEPEVVVDGGDMPMPAPMPPVMDENPQPLQVPAPEQPVVVPPMPPVAVVEPKPIEEPKPVVKEPGVDENVRVIEDRREVVFNPDKPVVAPKPVPVQKKHTAQKPVHKPVAKKVAKTSGTAWYVQFGSYTTRAAAEAAGAKIRAAHSNLFVGKQFVVLAAVLKDGRTMYRLRIAFDSSKDANGFCRNAKSDGLDCYVAK